MSYDLVVFSMIAAVTVLGALWAVMGSKTFHAVMGLGVVLISVAALYVSLNSPFLGVVQLLVYVGGIMTLFVFAVMFVAGDEEDESPQGPASFPVVGKLVVLLAMGADGLVAVWFAFGFLGGLFGGAWLGALTSLALAAVAGGLLYFLWRASWTARFGALVAAVVLSVMLSAVMATSAWSEPGLQGAEDFGALVDGLFGTHVIALEVLGVLLTAALIGAMVIARPLATPLDSTHYQTKLDRHGIEALGHVGDVTADLHATTVDLGGEEE